MRRFSFASLTSLLCLLTIAQSGMAQVGALYQMGGYNAATSDSGAPPPGSPRVLRRAAALVAMSASAPAAATTVWTTQEAGLAAQGAANAYQTALTSYAAGDRASADSAAQRAIQLAERAITTAMTGRSEVVEAVSGGDVAVTPSRRSPLPPVIITGGGRLAGRGIPVLTPISDGCHLGLRQPSLLPGSSRTRSHSGRRQ